MIPNRDVSIPGGSVRRVAHLTGIVLLVGAVLFVAVLVYPTLIGADQSYVVLSDSMRPTMESGDVVVTNEADPETIERGEIITYRDDTASSDLTTHRVVEVVENEEGLSFRTKGDANEEPDPRLVPASAVTGEVWFHVPYIGHLMLFAGTRTGILVLVTVPGVLLMVNEVYELLKSGLTEDADGAESSTENVSASPEDTDD